jgi:hypothetical protein
MNNSCNESFFCFSFSRWYHHLDSSIRKGDWTMEEDKIIFEIQKELGNQWSKIASLLNGRADIDVKNRFHKLHRVKFKTDELALPLTVTPDKATVNYDAAPTWSASTYSLDNPLDNDSTDEEHNYCNSSSSKSRRGSLQSTPRSGRSRCNSITTDDSKSVHNSPRGFICNDDYSADRSTARISSDESYFSDIAPRTIFSSDKILLSSGIRHTSTTDSTDGSAGGSSDNSSYYWCSDKGNPDHGLLPRHVYFNDNNTCNATLTSSSNYSLPSLQQLFPSLTPAAAAAAVVVDVEQEILDFLASDMEQMHLIRDQTNLYP